MSKKNIHNDPHQWVQNKLDAWVDPQDSSLSKNEGERIQTHIRECSVCKQTYDLLRDVFMVEDDLNSSPRNALPSLDLDTDKGWAKLERDIAADHLKRTISEDSITLFWKQAAVWLIAGLLIGWGLTLGIGERFIGSEKELTQVKEVWSEFEDAAAQDWVSTSDWTDEIIGDNQSADSEE